METQKELLLAAEKAHHLIHEASFYISKGHIEKAQILLSDADVILHDLCNPVNKSDCGKTRDALEKVINHIEKNYAWAGSEWELIREMCESALSSNEQWVKVEDRLPNERETVLCYLSTGEQECLCFWTNTDYKDKQGWSNYQNDTWYPLKNVTHWQPLRPNPTNLPNKPNTNKE